MQEPRGPSSPAPPAGSGVGDSGTLAINRSEVNTFGSVIAGTGELRQMGSGTTILTSDSTYSGGTPISAGVLQLGDGTTAGSVVGDILNNGTLTFNHSDLLVMMGRFPGPAMCSGAGDGSGAETARPFGCGLERLREQD